MPYRTTPDTVGLRLTEELNLTRSLRDQAYQGFLAELASPRPSRVRRTEAWERYERARDAFVKAYHTLRAYRAQTQAHRVA